MKKLLIFLLFFLISIVYTNFVTHGDMKLTASEQFSLGFNYTNALDNLKLGRFDLDLETSGGQIGELFHRNGKAYTYYGFFPVFLRGFIEIFCPRGSTEWSRISVLLAALLAVVSFSLAFYKFISNMKTTKGFKYFYLILFIIALSFGSSLLSLLSQANLYTEVIIWALAWNGVFICAFIYFIYSQRFNYLLLFLMSISGGFVLLSRIPSGFSSSIILIFLLFVFIFKACNFKNKRISFFLDQTSFKNISITKKQLILGLIALLLPWMLCVCFQLKVNYERWENPFILMDLRYYDNYFKDPGRRERFEEWGYLNYLRIPYGLFYYFVPTTNYFKESFPYIQLSGFPLYGAIPFDLPFSHFVFKAVGFDWNERGVPLPISSFYLVLVGIIGLVFLCKNFKGILLILFLPYLVHGIIMFSYMGQSLRYSSDFLPMLIVLSFASLKFFSRFEEKGTKMLRLLSRGLLICVTLVGVYAAVIVMYLEKLELWSVPASVKTQINSQFSQIEDKLSNIFNKKDIVLIVASNNLSAPYWANRGQVVVLDNLKTIFWFNGKYWLPVRDEENRYRRITSYGPISMKIKFSMANSPDIREPLLTTGKSGAGDIVYVEYLSDKKVIFGLDQWGSLGIRSKPVSIDPNKFYDLEISLGSLYPDVFLNKELLNKVEVKLGNKIVLGAPIGFHLTIEEEITVGENRIGGYQSVSRFAGEIREVKRGLKI